MQQILELLNAPTAEARLRNLQTLLDALSGDSDQRLRSMEDLESHIRETQAQWTLCWNGSRLCAPRRTATAAT